LSTDKYILQEDGTPALEPDLMKWAQWMETTDRHVAQDFLPGKVRVSTVFLGLDHNFCFDGGPPILFETMIFGGQHDMYQYRYFTREEAIAGHAKALALAKGEAGAS
jgi:hypothetical protein